MASEIDERQIFLLGDTMHEFILFLDGTTFINLWLSNILQSTVKDAACTDAAINYWSMAKFIQQRHFEDESAKLNNQLMDKMEVNASESERYFCGNLMSLKAKVAYHCDIELKFRDSTQWHEEWEDTLILDRYQQFSTVYCGYKREQSTKFLHFAQQIPTKKENELHSSKQWMECVNMDNLLKYLFDSTAQVELKTLDVYILDYTVCRDMDNPRKFTKMEDVTICFVKNDDFSNCFVGREWDILEA